MTAFQHKNYEKIKKSLGGDVLVALPLQYTPLGTLQDILAPIALLKNYQFLTESLIFDGLSIPLKYFHFLNVQVMVMKEVKNLH